MEETGGEQRAVAGRHPGEETPDRPHTRTHTRTSTHAHAHTSTESPPLVSKWIFSGRLSLLVVVARFTGPRVPPPDDGISPVGGDLPGAHLHPQFDPIDLFLRLCALSAEGLWVKGRQGGPCLVGTLTVLLRPSCLPHKNLKFLPLRPCRVLASGKERHKLRSTKRY